VNRGFSYLENNKNVDKDVELMLLKNKIFDNDIDINKNYFADFYVSKEIYRLSMNRNITSFNTEEMKKNQQGSFRGDLRTSIDSEVYKNGNSHIVRRLKKSHIFTDTSGVLQLTINHNVNFPNFDNKFIEEAYRVFFKLPETNKANHTIYDLMHDKETIKAAIKFFTDYGTHYVSDYTFGHRFGFYQDYKFSKTILKDKKGNTPKPDLLKPILLEKSSAIPPPDVLKSDHLLPMVAPKEMIVGAAPAPVQAPNDEVFKIPPPVDGKSDQPRPKNDVPNEIAVGATPGQAPKHEELKNDATPNSPVTPTQAGKDLKPDINQFQIGKCTIERFFLKVESCDMNNPRIIEVQTIPISNLFNPMMQVKRDFSAEGKPIEKFTMEKINDNMEFLFSEIQTALDPNLYVITKIESFNLPQGEAQKSNECLKVKPLTLLKIFKQYKQTFFKFFYRQNLFIKDKHLPVLSFKNYVHLKKNYNYKIISNSDKGLYWCQTRAHNVTPDELKSGKWEEKKYLTEVKVIIDHDSKPFTEAGYECTETWSFVDKKSKNEARWHFCTKWTTNFMNPMIITDVKFFDFNANMHKCTNKILTTYIDGKSYECDCDLNFNTISDDIKQGDTFLCKSRKVSLYSVPETPNHPVFTGTV
jgi:hypothetical protein